MKRTTGQSGFTLIEIIVSLILVGIMAAVAGLGVVQATRAFIFTKEATVIGQKGDLAMTRLRRSVQNLTTISTASAAALTVRRLENGEDVTEAYSLSGNNLLLTDSRGSNTAQILSDAVQALTFTYRQSDGSVWSPSYNAMSDLATVDVSLSLRGQGGSSITYADKIVPRNTYISGGRAYTPSGMTSGGFNCFVATVAYGNGDYPSVKVLRQFRDRYLLTSAGGKSFVRWYYKNGPDLAAAFKASSASRAVVRLALLPLVGMAFLILYFPAGILLMALTAWLLAMLFMKTGIFHRIAVKATFLASPGGARGSILLGLIVTMVAMAALMGAMVSMYSAANAASVPAYFAQKAYYLAESGRNYATKTFLANRDDTVTSASAFITNVHNRTFPVDSSTSTFKVLVTSFYYNYTGGGGNLSSLTVSPFGLLPNFSIPSSPQGVIQVGSATPISFTDVTYSSSQNLTFTMPVTAIAGAGIIRPGVTLNGAQTIYAKNYGDSLGDTLTINIGTNNQGAFMLPPVNGAMSFTSVAGETWYFLYDKITTVGGNRLLTGIRNFPGKKPLPTAGISMATGSPVILGRYAQFTSTGTVGTGVMAASQTIKQNQPLDAVEVFTMAGGAINPLTPVLGNFAQVTQDGGPATKITQTVQTYSYIGSTPTYMQESFQAVQWSSPNPLQLLWNQSNQLLSYDLQAKIKFTETEDDDSSNPINIPGSYMPGITFRVKCTPGSNNKDCTYYGMSFMRGTQGRNLTGNTGCGGSGYYTEEDDISDNLFAQYGSNSSAHPDASDITCSGTDRFVPNVWNSNNVTQSSTPGDPIALSGGAPLDGIPYILFWQKDWSRSQGICGGTTSPWDWLSFMPLVEGRVQQVYHYLPSGTRPDGWYQGRLPSTDPRYGNSSYEKGPFTAWKLMDKYGVLKTHTVEGVAVLGVPGEVIIRDSTTATATSAGTPLNKYQSVVTPVGWILPNTKDSTYSSYTNDDYIDIKARRNYRIYPKPWVTLVARIIEMTGNFDCNTANGDERVNAILGYVTDTEGVSGTYGASGKDAIRKAYGRNINYPSTASYTVRWPDVDDYFTMAVWGNGNYSSKTVPAPANNCGWVSVPVKIVEKGFDSDGDYVTAYTAFLTTNTSPSYFGTSFEYPEFGYHTAGISAPSTCTTGHCETAYFTDGYWQAYRGGRIGVLPGIQEQ